MRSTSVPVSQFITTDPVIGREDMDMDELKTVLRKHDIRHLPIVRGDEVVGVVSERDVRLVSGLSPDEQKQIRASDLMTTEPYMVEASAQLEDVARIMASQRIGSVIVNDEDGLLLGIFTATDALRALVEMIHKAPRSLLD